MSSSITGIPKPMTVGNNQIRIVKGRDIVTTRTVLRNLDYLETQIGRLDKSLEEFRNLRKCLVEMAQNIRADIALLTTE